MTARESDLADTTQPLTPIAADLVPEQMLRRRRDDFANSRIMFEMVRFLMTKPTSDQVAQQLVLGLMNEHHSKGAVISVFEQDGTLRVLGSFGMSPLTLKASSDLSLWDASPMTDALRHGEPVILPTAEAVEQRYPWLGNQQNPHEPLATWPLALPSERIGAVEVIFSESPDPERLRADVAGVAAILALYFSLVSKRPAGPEVVDSPRIAGNGHSGSHGGNRSTLDAEDPRVARALSERQMQILALMAKGLTNGQIAARVGFSESTVRQETMAIYRFLNVGGRHEAVRIAGLRGMLEQSPESKEREARERMMRMDRAGLDRTAVDRMAPDRTAVDRTSMDRMGQEREMRDRLLQERMDRMMPGQRG
jgi:DNA-binding CsgD family transcriptional regulator